MATTSPWSSGIGECCKHCGICWYAMWCPACLYGDIVSKTTQGDCCFNCLLWFLFSPLSCFFAGPNRTKLRAKYNLPEEPCSDCIVHTFCKWCALCQEARELQYRAFHR